MSDESFIVAALVDPDAASRKERRCILVKEGEGYTMDRRQVFGPASKAECEEWVNDNCIGVRGRL